MPRAAFAQPFQSCHRCLTQDGSAAYSKLPAVQCIEGDNDLHRVCFFSDIYMYNGTLYYLTPSKLGAWLCELEAP